MMKAAEGGGMTGHDSGMHGEGCRGRQHGEAWRWLLRAAWQGMTAACMAKAAEGGGMARHARGGQRHDAACQCQKMAAERR